MNTRNILIIFILLISLTSAYSERLYDVEFKYDPFLPAKSVHLVGSFNNWDNTADPMSDEDRDGVWTITKKLPPGKHFYKFYVNGNEWVTDKNADDFVSDGFGGQNSVVVVGNFDYLKSPAKKGDGKLVEDAVFFDTSIQYFNPISENRYLFILQTRENDITDANLILFPGTDKEKKEPLHFVSTVSGLDYFELITNISEDQFSFIFEINDGGKTWYLDKNKLEKKVSAKTAFEIKVDSLEIFSTPDWVKEAVFYQIFPDRFRNGNPSNDPLQDKRRPEGKEWNIADSYLEDWETGKPSWANFFGGDLKGVQENLDYLDSLGITAIYFNPLFESFSNHKYDTVDYYRIDDNFGTNTQFKELVTQLHSRGIKVIIDGVFNHTADEFKQFEDIKEKGPKSEYYDWYFIKKWPFPEEFSENKKPSDYYDCWWGFGDLPKLNTDNEEVKKMLLDVSEFWIKQYNVDGWRLDVPNEIPHPFWKKFRVTVKSADKDAYIVGEIWDNAYAWLRGDEFDAVMNYRFRTACIDFFAKRNIKPSEFHRRQMEIMLDYPRQAYYVLLNLLDSHDTTRFLTECGGDKDRHKLAVLCQLTMPGAPMVYYGDEVGLEGQGDPNNRKPFPEDKSKFDRDMLEYYKKLIAIRNSSKALSIGEYYSFYVDDKNFIYGYVRKYEDEKFIIIINNTNNTNKIDFLINREDPGVSRIEEQISGKSYSLDNGKLTLELQPNSGYILKLIK